MSGCKKEETPPAQVPASVQKKAPPKGQSPVQGKISSAQLTPHAGQQFDVSSKKDPFKPYVIEQKAAKPVHRTRSEDALPIQQYEVGQFRVAGIIVGLKENRAQIIDPMGKAYIVREGMRIGSNDGKIVKISATGIEVLELFREDNGKIVRRIVKLTLAKKG